MLTCSRRGIQIWAEQLLLSLPVWKNKGTGSVQPHLSSFSVFFCLSFSCWGQWKGSHSFEFGTPAMFSCYTCVCVCVCVCVCERAWTALHVHMFFSVHPFFVLNCVCGQSDGSQLSAVQSCTERKQRVRDAKFKSTFHLCYLFSFKQATLSIKHAE